MGFLLPLLFVAHVCQELGLCNKLCRDFGTQIVEAALNFLDFLNQSRKVLAIVSKDVFKLLVVFVQEPTES